MATFQSEQTFPRPIDEVFAYFAQPANLIAAAPADFNLELESGPDEARLGAVFVIKGRRFGMPNKIVTEVIAFVPPTRIVDEQREGLLRKWIRTMDFTEVSNGTKVAETIEFEPPGGMLGLVVNESFVRRDLQRLEEHRREKLAAELGRAE